jgi:hypothetical protein
MPAIFWTTESAIDVRPWEETRSPLEERGLAAALVAGLADSAPELLELAPVEPVEIELVEDVMKSLS